MNRTINFLSVATFSTFALLSTSALSATKIGVVSAADPSVRIVDAGGAERQVKLGDTIYADDTIKTDAKGKAQLVFEDRSTITVNENSELKIDHFIYDPASESGKMSMNNVKGAFRFIGGALSKKNPVTIKTPVATIGIRGGIVDTHVQPNGQTNAVFVYGNQMTMTNAAGQTSVITDYGTGLTLADANAVPAPLPPEQVQQSLGSFTTETSAGGGISTPPNPETIQQQMNLQTESKTPEPLAAGQPSPSPQSQGNVTPPTNNAAAPSQANPNADSQTSTAPTDMGENQDPAPIIMVADDSVTMMDMTDMMQGVAMQQNDSQVQEASASPEKMREMVKDSSLTQQLANNAALKEFFGDAPPPASLTPLATDDVKDGDTLPLPLTEISKPLPPEIGNLPPSGGSGVPSETFTAVTGRTGNFSVIGADGVVLNRGEMVVTDESATNYKVSFTSSAPYSLPVRSITLPKLTNTVTNASTITMQDGGSTVTRTLSGYRTQTDAMQVYALTNNAATGAEEKDINFIVGKNVFIAPDSFASAAARSLAAANNGGSSAHGVATNGVLLYDFLPEIGEGDDTKFGNFNYNRAAGVTHSNLAPRQNDFGVAVDWNDRGGKKGNLFSGQVNWLPEGGKSSATATFGKADASPTGGNDFNIAGKRLSYEATSGTYDPSNAGTFKHAAIAIGNYLYASPTSAIEGGVLRYVTPTDVNSAVDSAATNFALAGANVDNQGLQAIALKGDVSSNANLTQGVVASHNAGRTYKGFASGVMMRHNASTYAPVAFSSSNDVNDVTVNTSNTGAVGADFTVRDVDTDGVGGGTNSVNATFSQPNSVYINNKLYASQQEVVTHDDGTPVPRSGADAAKGFIVSGGLVSNGQPTNTAYRCSDCEFVHWGVWAGDVGKNTVSASAADYANMIPYVAGDVANVSNLPSTGTANYKGEAYATVYKSGINPKNITGTMDASVDMAAKEMTNFALNFGTVEGEALNLRNVTSTTPNIAVSGDAGFAPIALESSGGNAISGAANGALFGSGANAGKEIGGNYVFNRTTDGLNGGGIYFGKERP
jgi:hypothetical protein